MDAETPQPSRSLHRVDFIRGGIVFVAVTLLFIACFLALPSIQKRVSPAVPGGAMGPWLIRPEWTFRIGVSALVSALSIPLLMRPLHRLWIEQDAALGGSHNPLGGPPGKRLGIYLRAGLTAVACAISLFAYFGTWVIIGPDYLEHRLFWRVTKFHYGYVRALEIPDIRRSNLFIGEEGASYKIQLTTGQVIFIGMDNEGMTRDELAAIGAFLEGKTKKKWKLE